MNYAPHAGEPKGLAYALAFLKTDERSEVNYAAGFVWAKDGEIKSPAGWRSYFESFARGMKYSGG